MKTLLSSSAWCGDACGRLTAANIAETVKGHSWTPNHCEAVIWNISQWAEENSCCTGHVSPWVQLVSHSGKMKDEMIETRKCKNLEEPWMNFSQGSESRYNWYGDAKANP